VIVKIQIFGDSTKLYSGAHKIFYSQMAQILISVI